nr:g-type lectin s-receptor-like serine/threonine-protein kinase [Quercus suber]
MLDTKPLFVFCLLSFFRLSATIDTIIPSHSIRDGETLVSAGGTFELGFFSPGNSKGRYLGIWYRISTDTVIWVANRETLIANRSGVLKVTNEGNIVLFNNTNSTVWSSNTSRAAASPVVKLLDSGNLVVKDGNGNGLENLLWQSFDYPCDTLMPGMKLGKNFVTGRDWFLTSWKSTDDPAKGEFSLRIDTHGLPQQVSMKGDKIKARGGPWNGLSFSGYPRLRPNPIFEYEFVMNKTEVYYVYTLVNSSVFSRLVFYPSGVWGRLIWRDQTHSWEIYSTSQVDQCENYAYCGAYATCNSNRSPVCACLQGFVSKSPKNWNSVDWSDGCVRRTPLECNRDGFLKYTNVKLPDTSSSWFNITMSLEECEELCLKNCSCTAYSNLDIRGKGSGCLLWFGNLNDMRVDQDGQDIYIRLANSELDNSEKNRHSSKIKQVRIIVGSALLVMGILILGVISYVWKKKISFKGITRKNYNYVDDTMNPKISDFGLARTFGGDQTEAKTKRIVGTHGYMSPEYAGYGQFSIKSDVFSFGVLVLEIVSGKRNREFCHFDDHLNLLGLAWRLWIEDQAMELIDKSIGDMFTLSDQVLRCIHVGLLCVQQRPEDRPDMSSVVLMLSSESLLPKPRQPGFYSEKARPIADSSSTKHEPVSTNEISMTLLKGR